MSQLSQNYYQQSDIDYTHTKSYKKTTSPEIAFMFQYFNVEMTAYMCFSIISLSFSFGTPPTI